MSGTDREPWKTATSLTQSLLDECADNLSCGLEMICEISLPGGGTIYASDRNKYVGNRFYEALLKFPAIERTIGEWLSSETEFSTLTLDLSNVDGRFNSYLPSGANFGGWIGKQVLVKLGLRDVSATYRTLFKGKITDIGGFGRTTQTITIIARDDNDVLNTQFPQEALTTTDFPYLESDKDGTLIPFILGDWTTGLSVLASVPGLVVNGNDPDVYGGARNNVRCVISVNALSYFDSANVYLRRGTDLWVFDSGDILNVSSDKNYFEVDQAGTTLIEGSPYSFETGDEFFVRVRGPLLSGYRDNAVSQAKKILDTFAPGAVTYSSSWNTYRDKASPAQSAVVSIKSRVWIQEQQAILTYVKSLLQQVRIEAFFNESLEFELAAMHFEDFDDAPSFTTRNWDVEKGSFKTSVDERNVFNRAQGSFNFEPLASEETMQTKFWKSTDSIAQLGKTISKILVFPNLYIQSDVENQIVEILRLACSATENIDFIGTWRCLLQELGGFIAMNVVIGPSQFVEVPCRIRTIGYLSEGMKLSFKLTSFQMFPFKSWSPGYAGIVGGQSATIVQE
jgi:hypothetical protein